MSEYYPDNWVLVEFIKDNIATRKVLAGWHGGYLGSDEWRLSSGVTKIVETETGYEIHNESGSIYYCNKRNMRLSGVTGPILNRWLSEAEKSKDSITITVYTEEDIKNAKFWS